MKKLSLTGVLMALVLWVSAHVPVCEKAVRNFSRDYKGASAAEWQPLKEGGYICRFTIDGIGKKAFYDKKGNWTSTVAGYTENRMPRGLRKVVAFNYYDFSILYVHEVCMAGKPTVYMVQVQDKKVIKILRVIDGEVEEMRELEAAA